MILRLLVPLALLPLSFGQSEDAGDAVEAARQRQLVERAELDRREAIASSVGSLLNEIAGAFAAGTEPISDELAKGMVSPDASAASVLPAAGGASWTLGSKGAPITVLSRSAPERSAETEAEAEGEDEPIEAFRAVLSSLEGTLGGRPTRPGEIKVKRVTRSADTPGVFDVHVRARHLRRAADAAVFVTSWWDLQVEVGTGERLLLMNWSAWNEREVRLGAAPGSTDSVDVAGAGFVDVAGAVFDAPIAASLDPSIPELRNLLDSGLDVGILGHHGVAVADVNQDGIDDLYLCQPGGVPNQLWLRQADGTATEVATAAGVDLIDATTSAIFADLDGDGDQDLVLGLGSGLHIFARDAKGFVEAQVFERIGVTSIAAGDVDRDGRVDLYACAYANPYGGTTFPVPYHAAENGQANLFLWNRTDVEDALRFEDATQPSGLSVGAARFSFAATFEDYDDDGDLDLYVANDFGRNSLYVNTGAGSFIDRAADLGGEDIAAGMSAAFADFDRDGRLDLYVSNMESSAGSRVTAVEGFHGATSADERALLKRHARGNTLFRGGPGGTLVETSIAKRGQWSWGAIPVDLDADGFLDLFVPNGFVTGSAKGKPDL